MLIKTEAIVLNRIRYTDNSFVVNLYSKELGRISALVRTSAKKPDSKANIFAPLNVICTEFKVKDTRTVQNISYHELIKSPTAQNNDISKICISQFIAEVILKMVREEERNENLYNFFISTIDAIEKTNNNIVNVHLIFLKEFARHIGFGITNNFCEETPYFNTREGMFLPVYTTDEESFDNSLSQSFSQLLKMNYELNECKFPYSHRKKMIEVMLSYYKMHSENFTEIKSLKVMNDIFGE